MKLKVTLTEKINSKEAYLLASNLWKKGIKEIIISYPMNSALSANSQYSIKFEIEDDMKSFLEDDKESDADLVNVNDEITGLENAPWANPIEGVTSVI